MAKRIKKFTKIKGEAHSCQRSLGKLFRYPNPIIIKQYLMTVISHLYEKYFEIFTYCGMLAFLFSYASNIV